MNPTERDDLNKRIAEDLGWHRISFIWHSPECRFESGIACSSLGCGPLPNFTADPACTLLLMERGKIGMEPHEGKWVAAPPLTLDGRGIPRTDDARIAPTIGEAVALAYAKMRNLK